MTAFRLLVDDETEFLETLVKGSQREVGCDRDPLSGKEALRILNERTPVDVIVLDVKLSAIWGIGIETLKRSRSSGRQWKLSAPTRQCSECGRRERSKGMGMGIRRSHESCMDIDEFVYKLQDAYKKKWCAE